MDQHYTSAASKLEEILKTHKGRLSREKTYMSALIKELKDGVPRTKDVKAKFQFLEDALKKNEPGVWKQIEKIRNSLATDEMGTVRTESSTASPEPEARALGDSEIGFLAKSFRVILAILETNCATEPFPEPDERQKEKLGECYKYALKVANICKERERDLEHAYQIIGDICNQVMEVDVDQLQETSGKPMTTSFKTDSEGNGSTVTKKTEHDRASELDKKDRTASSGLKKTYPTSSSMNAHQEKSHVVQNKTEPNIAQEIEMKSKAVSSAIKKMKDTKGYLAGASKIVQELYSQAMEVNDDHAQEKPGTRTATSSMKVTGDTGHTGPTKTEPDIAKELDMKGKAVAAALNQMKDTKGNLKRASKIIEDLHSQLMEDTIDQELAKPDKSTTTEPKKGDDTTGYPIPPKTVPQKKLEKEGSDRSSSITQMKDTTTSSNKVTQENEHTLPKTTEPTVANELEIKGLAILQKIKDTKSQVKTLKKNKKFMVQLLDALHEIVTGVEHNTSTAPSRHELTTNILRTFEEKKNEAEYAACLLEELSNFSHATNNDDNGNILTPPQNVETSHDFKEKDDKNVDNSRRKTPQCTHDESLMKCYRCASHVLKNMKESERLRKDLGIKKGQIEDLMERLKHIQNENTKLVKEADSLRTRLSEHAGALLHHDNPAIADLSDPNRATKLGEKYLELYDNQWTDAFSKLQTEYSSASDEELTGYLYKLLVIRPKEEVSKGFSNILTDAAKLSSNVASGNIAKAFVKNEGTKTKHGKRIQLCETYIQECVELCWYMHVQAPPLYLDLNTTKGHAFEKNKYKEYTTSGKKIAFVVWPALFLHENGPLLSKGVAQGDSTRKQAAGD